MSRCPRGTSKLRIRTSPRCAVVAHLDEDLVVGGNRLLHITTLKDFGGTVGGTDRCPHAARSSVAATDARAGALNPLAMSQMANTISWRPIGALRTLLTLVKPKSWVKPT